MGGIDGGSTLHTALGVSSNIVTITFFVLSTLKPSWQMVKKKGGGGILMSPWTNQLYLFMLFNCLLWVFYGLPFNRPHNFWVILTNGVGAVLAMVAVIAYYHYASQRHKVIVEWEVEVFSALFCIMAISVFLFNNDRHTRVLIVGSISSVFSSCMHLALLSELGLAWINKDMTLLHPFPSIAAFVKGSLWTAYGWNAKDPFIVVPNAIGVATGIVQLIIGIIIRRRILAMMPDKRSIYPDDEMPNQPQELEIAELKLKISQPLRGVWVMGN